MSINSVAGKQHWPIRANDTMLLIGCSPTSRPIKCSDTKRPLYPPISFDLLVNNGLEAAASSITKLAKIGVKLYTFEVAESEFRIHFKKNSLKKPKSYLNKSVINS